MASSNRRQRQIDAARAQRRAERVAAKNAARERNVRLKRGAIVLGLLAGFLLVWNQPWKTSPQSATADSTPSATPTTSASPTGTGNPLNLPTPLPSRSVVPAPTSTFANYAGMALLTNVGNIGISLDENAPRTLASMAHLSSLKYFANTTCHRLTTEGIYVLQCGDPNGDGTGDPGYSIPDENLPSTTNPAGRAIYPRGTVAMANSGPNTNGSQFFLVYRDSPLPPKYTVWGKVTLGLDVIDRVAAAGVAGGLGDGRPNMSVVIKSTTVR